MANPLMFFKRQLALKIESTYGTLETLAAADAGFKVNDRELVYPEESTEREKADGTLGYDNPVPNGLSSHLTFKSWMAGKGATGVPNWSAFLQACGMGLASSTYTQTGTLSSWKSLSCGVYQDGRNKVARGLMGNVKIPLITGKPCELDWSFLGGWNATPSDSPLLAGQSFAEATPPIFAGSGSFSLGSGVTTTRISKADIDLGAVVSLREDPNSPGGYIGGWISTFHPRITLDPEAALFATQNWYTAHLNGTTVTATFVVGSAANNTITIAATGLQPIKPPQDQNRNGKLVDALDFAVTGAVSIAFT